MPTIPQVLKSFVNVFAQRNEQAARGYSYGGTVASYSSPRSKYANERSIISSIYTKIAVDCAGVEIRHVKLDELGRYTEDVDGTINELLLFKPNSDQDPRAFRQDIYQTMFADGYMAVVPVDMGIDEATGEIIEIYSFRVGSICEFKPRHVRVSLYNEDTGNRQDIIVEKRYVGIAFNPFYDIMNEPNSTLKRLTLKLAMLDSVDEATASGKLDLIIQLPYVIKSDARRRQAEDRRKDIEFQLKGSKYGIAYTDGTEKITQLNRPAENNLLKQIEYLQNQLYSELGLTPAIMDGTADEAAMINYHNRTVEPLLDAVAEAMQGKFVGLKKFKKQERVKHFRNPFKYIPLSTFADIADKLNRNEIASSNEIRGFVGLTPSKDPKADMLINSNMPQPQGFPGQPGPPQVTVDTQSSLGVGNN